MLNFSWGLIFILSTFQQGANPDPSPSVFDTYCNARFGYCIHYPNDLLYPQREADNGDGRANSIDCIRAY